jgi:Bacterial PH domain
MRLLCAAIGAVVFGALLVVALTLPSSSTGVVEFGVVDQVAIAGLGLILGVGIALLGRSRVDADTDGIRVRNVVMTREFGWRTVRAVRFDRKSSWASLLLENGDETAVLAVQAADREHAVRAVEGLRALHAAARANDPLPPPLLYPE